MVEPLTKAEELEIDLYTGRCRAGREAAREIARRVEAQHGFWDFKERRGSSMPENIQSVEESPVGSGEDPRRFLTVLPGGGEPPELAA
jgi:hypothetical protein